jgi:hypothetical protein
MLGDEGAVMTTLDGVTKKNESPWKWGSSKLTGQVRGGESGAGPMGAGAVEAYPAP